ncbi:MAG TPA: hypothetical protein VHD57_14535 [Vicinamibacterales bacterium]|jgi:hypothetical protein|nr:hypothetical protein [Vicinamibacterales bacterium]
MHSECTIRPQLFHIGRLARLVTSPIALVVVLVVVSVGAAAAQSLPAEAVARVFLKSGEALPSYGEPALVGDRIVFNLLIDGSRDPAVVRLVSLPVASIDLARTTAYATTLRGAFYAATRGEADYAALMTSLSSTLDALTASGDTAKRLALAQETRDRLLAWSRDHYHYRDADIGDLVSLVDEVIGELRAGTGQSSFSLDLVARTAPAAEPILAVPGVDESVTLALAAAKAADVDADRRAILDAAAAAAAGRPDLATLQQTVAREAEAERLATTRYAALAADVRAKAETAADRGDADAIRALRDEVSARDREYGQRRPQLVGTLLDELRTRLEAAEARRLALEHYAYVRGTLLAYERQVRPAFSGLDGLAPVLRYVRDQHEMAFDRIVNAEARLAALQEDVAAVVPPKDVAGIHATLESALAMAREACARRRQAVVANDLQMARNASSAAAGALLLVARARADLVAALYPPKSSTSTASAR